MRSTLALVLALSAFVAAPAMAHGPTAGAVFDPGYAAPSAGEVDAAIEAAAAEFAVPEELVKVMAWVEGRYEHVPFRVSADGRAGLFQIAPERLALASDFLDLDANTLVNDLDEHARAMAFLLAATAPSPATDRFGNWDFDAWRDTLVWVSALDTDVADSWVDHLYERLDSGVIDQTTDGEPVAIAPLPVQTSAIGGFSAAMRSGPGADYPGVIYNTAPSCNHTAANRGLSDVNYIVIHTTQGSYAGSISWFLNCSSSVSAHYVIRASDGEITQTLDEEDIGWHAGNWTYNSESIGIEHEGFVANSNWVTAAMENASAALSANILADYNLPATRTVIVGHNEVPGATHTDPGQYWDWSGYMALVTGGATPSTGDLVGYIRHTDLYEPTYGIAGATVTVSGGNGTQTTDSAGYYSLPGITAGTFDVCATAPGYGQTCETKTVAVGVTNWKSMLLTPVPVGDDDDDE
ncbi:MAG: N-acetylmuramoyl-L-alanine amidase, partial [Deltaproteobacteria bacterium]|nr:N-acetylmuramoyl-L-alanine amidase [Deltaproteobacteria bacterium]